MSTTPGEEPAATDRPAVDPALLRPLDVDGVGAVAFGTAAWAVALVVALLLRDRLEAAGNGWWVWVCLAGTVLGLIGLPYLVRRRTVYRAAKARAAAQASASGEAGTR